MTLREAYIAVLAEVNKREAPSLLLADFNYFFNKAIYQFINKKYNYYDTTQQLDDDLDAIRVVGTSISLTLQGNYYKGTLPINYLHILNCEVFYNVLSNYRCYRIGDTYSRPAQRQTSGASAQLKKNYYFTPSYKNPYFYRNNTLLEIRSGNVSIFKPTTVIIDYLKKPATVLLTEDQIDLPSDTSTILEFPDMICLEIINEMVKLVMENTSDPRLQTNIPINQTISNPMQQNSR